MAALVPPINLQRSPELESVSERYKHSLVRLSSTPTVYRFRTIDRGLTPTYGEADRLSQPRGRIWKSGLKSEFMSGYLVMGYLGAHRNDPSTSIGFVVGLVRLAPSTVAV